MTVETKRRKQPTPQLRVVFDTNILYTGSASDLVRQEVVNLIKESAFPDLEIQWYLPEVVRHERQYQMQKRALELLPAVTKVERLLGHNLAITEQILVQSVEKVVSQRHEELGLLSLPLSYAHVDWHGVFLDAVYRRPPFKEGETEKGFRDRIVVECFLQLVADSPRTPKICRIVLVSGDGLVVRAVEDRTAGLINTNVLSTLEELKGLINTLVSQVDERFLAILKPKAKKLFFVPKDESTLFYKERIREKLQDKFATELALPPQGATSRTNGTWLIGAPNFVKKTARRIQWTSSIDIEAEASKTAHRSPTFASGPINHLRPAESYTQLSDLMFAQNPGFEALGRMGLLSDLVTPAETSEPPIILTSADSGIKTHKGVDRYDVLWSADVTTSKELRRPSIDEVRRLEPTWEQVS
jgi:hypothetical protein